MPDGAGFSWLSRRGKVRHSGIDCATPAPIIVISVATSLSRRLHAAAATEGLSGLSGTLPPCDKAAWRGWPGAGAALNPAFFARGFAHDANDNVIYTQATGVLAYDFNGSAAGGSTLVAVFATRPALTAADFQLV